MIFVEDTPPHGTRNSFPRETRLRYACSAPKINRKKNRPSGNRRSDSPYRRQFDKFSAFISQYLPPPLSALVRLSLRQRFATKWRDRPALDSRSELDRTNSSPFERVSVSKLLVSRWPDVTVSFYPGYFKLK